jgi:hypothetical protein
MWNLVLFHLEMVLILPQDRSMGCAEQTIGSEIILDAPDVLLSDNAQVDAHYGPKEMVLNLMQDRCTVCAKHTIGSEIVLDTPNGTPR